MSKQRRDETELSVGAPFAPIIAAYGQERRCSSAQRAVLSLHFEGYHNKEIAAALQMAPATVHEHWRRIAAKVGCRGQSAVVADVYRYLATRFTFVIRPLELTD